MDTAIGAAVDGWKKAGLWDDTKGKEQQRQRERGRRRQRERQEQEYHKRQTPE